METKKPDAKSTASAAESAIRHSITRIESSLDKVTPKVRGALDETLTELRHRLETLPSVGEGVGKTATKGKRKAEAAAIAASRRLAESAEHLADAVSKAPVPSNRKAFRAGQKAIADTANKASKELRRATGGERSAGRALAGGAFLAAAAAAVVLVRRASRK